MSQLKWHEPRAYRRARFYQHGARNPWDPVKVAAVTFLVLIALRATAAAGPGDRNPPGWPSTLALAAAIAAFVAYGLPILLGFVSLSLVILSDKGVNNNIIGHGATFHFWPWDDIERCETSVETIGERTFRTFTLRGEGGRVLATLGLPEKPTAAEIDAWLREHGKRLDTDEPPVRKA